MIYTTQWLNQNKLTPDLTIFAFKADNYLNCRKKPTHHLQWKHSWRYIMIIGRHTIEERYKLQTICHCKCIVKNFHKTLNIVNIWSRHHSTGEMHQNEYKQACVWCSGSWGSLWYFHKQDIFLILIQIWQELGWHA